MNFKEIDIGKLINVRLQEKGVSTQRVCRFFNCSESHIENLLQSKNIDTDILMKWSKLLEYDFFRIFSQHLILYAPQGNIGHNKIKNKIHAVPQFRKNIYTKQLIDFILESIENKEKTINDVITDYGIPKTTLYKWIKKREE
ncbi:MAG: transposase [Bacilli bacterium]